MRRLCCVRPSSQDRCPGLGCRLLLLLGLQSQHLECNFTSWLWLKLILQVYGPHIAVLYARAASLQDSVSSLSHHFLDVKTKSYKLQPGGPGYELVYACTGVTAYLKSLSVTHTIEATFELIKEHEQGLIARLLMFLRSDWCTRRGVRIVGDHSIGPARVPTISFVVIGDRAIRSQDIVKAFDQQGDVRRLYVVCRIDAERIAYRSVFGMDTSTRIRSSTTSNRR